MLTHRQKQVLEFIKSDLDNDLNWIDRVLSNGRAFNPEWNITWEEMHWLNEECKGALERRIEAMLFVDNILEKIHEG